MALILCWSGFFYFLVGTGESELFTLYHPNQRDYMTSYKESLCSLIMFFPYLLTQPEPSPSVPIPPTPPY